MKKNQIVDAHNYYRRRVQPGAADMKLMEWSNCLEEVAEWLYEYLIYTLGTYHNRDRTSDAHALGCQPSGDVGENLYWYSLPITNVSVPVEAWYDELPILWYQILNLVRIFMRTLYSGCVGKYLQDRWMRKSLNCFARGRTYLLCNYLWPSGTVIITMARTPYKIGTSCSECAHGYNSCNDGLCACSDIRQLKLCEVLGSDACLLI